MKLNRKLLICLALLLSCALATTGTIAYLSDTDSDVNVMTLGNVSIEQIELQRKDGVKHNATAKAGDLVPFEQGKPLYPAYPLDDTAYTAEANDLFFWGDYVYTGTAGNGLWNDEKLIGALDKFVFVKNTGSSPAYFRTFIAFECPEGMEYSEGPDKEFMMNVNGSTIYDDVGLGYATIDGTRYLIYCFTYQNALQPGDTSHPSLLQVVMTHNADNEDMEKLGDTYEILVLTQAVQTANMPDAATALNAAFGAADIQKAAEWFGETSPNLTVSTAAELQAALDNATDGTTIILASDITGDVTATQKPGVKVTIEGLGNTFAGVLLVDGKSGTYTTAGLTIKDVNFKADSISADACIRLGNGTNATRYTCNVTVENCTFDVPGAVGVKSYTGGDKNLKVINCKATANAHSLIQAKGIDGILVEGCTVNSKNGLNFNNSTNVEVIDCEVDVKGYAVRFGESSGGVGAAETYLIKDCTLKSANADGDATIILRGTADNSTLTIVNTTIVGTPDITNTAAGATVIR